MHDKEESTSTSYTESYAAVTVHVSTPIFFNSPYFEWFIIGGSIGTFIIIVGIAIACWYNVKKKRRMLAKEKKGNLDSIDIEKSSELMYMTTTDSSMDSAELPKNKAHKNLRQSFSLDVGAPFLLRKHSVQPSATLPRLHSLSSPRASITGLHSDLNKSSDSDDNTSVSSADSGQLWFSVLYKEEEGTLQVTLVRAKHLPARGLSKGVRDPFVKVFLLPDEENFQQSKVRKRTLSPKFNEVFNFKVQKDEFSERSLRFSVYDVDKRKIRHCLGHVVVSLDKLDLNSNALLSKELDKVPQAQSIGELQISLSCNPFNNRLKVTVSKAKNVDILGCADTSVYIKVNLFHGQKLMKCKRTMARNITGPTKTDLIFHETLSFGVPAKFYDSCYVALTAMVSRSGEIADKALGKVNLGPFLFSRGEQLLHWQEMISNPRTMVTRWHRLEPNR